MSQRHYVVVRDDDSTVHSSMTLPDDVDPPLQLGHSAHETPRPFATHAPAGSRLLWPSLDPVTVSLPASGRTQAARRIEELERQQARPLRELALGINPEAATAKLQALQAQVLALRSELTDT